MKQEYVTRSDIKRLTTHPVEMSLRYKLERVAFHMGMCTYMSKYWGKLDETSEYYGFREDAPVFEPFQVLHNTSVFIYKIAQSLQDEPTHLRADTILGQNIFYVNDIQALHREPVAHVKRDANNQFLPIGTHESYLSSAILRGEKPWRLVKDYYKNLTKAMQIHPPVTLALMEVLGGDLLSPNFPALDNAQLSLVADAMDRWYEHKHDYSGGVEFFMATFQELGLLPSEGKWEDIIKLLPRLERFVDYNLPARKLQSRQYYMQLLFDESLYGLHRRVHLNENNETISCLIVRRKDAKILSFATNKPNTATGGYDHAELLTVSLARQFLNDPENPLDDCDIYVSCDPCQTCGPELKKLNANVFYGTDTSQGSKLFQEGGKILEDEFLELFTKKLGWLDFAQ